LLEQPFFRTQGALRAQDLLAFSVAVLLFAGELAWSQPASADPVLPGLTTIGEVNIGFQKGLFPAGLQVGGLLAGLPIVRVVPDASSSRSRRRWSTS